MTPEEAIYSKLVAATAINALVVGRVLPDYLPQGTALPALLYQRISGPRVHSMTGASGTAYPRITITSWGKTYKKAKELADLVRRELDGFKGTVDTLYIQSCLLQDERDVPEIAPQDDALRRFGIAQDYIIWHDET